MTGRKAAIVVVAGYVAALLAAFAVFEIRQRSMRGPVSEASAGMSAFGDALLFLGVFAVVALVPTGVALHAMRRFDRFWPALANAALGVAATGVLAVAMYAFTAAHASDAFQWSVLALLRMLASPVLCAGFALAGFIAPEPRWRKRLFAAAAVDGAIVVCVVAFVLYAAFSRAA